MTNKRPISQAKSADLRGSLPALRRAAERARQIAAQTGTAIIIERAGKLERVYPAPDGAVAGVREKASTYRKKRVARK
jgi:hypothetical protein